MKYAVEARAFYCGSLVTKVREAEDHESNKHSTTPVCEVWIDVFDDYNDAEQFAAQYWRE